MISRIRLKTRGSRQPLAPGRVIVSDTGEPFLPRIFWTASSMRIECVGVSSIFTTWSPVVMPAFAAGVPSIADMTVRTLS